MSIRSISDLGLLVGQQPQKKTLVLAVAQDPHALEACIHAARAGYIDPILVGDKDQIHQLAQELNIDLAAYPIEHQTNATAAVEAAVSIVRQGTAQILMKGNVPTATLLKGILHKDNGLRASALLSHLAFFQLPGYHKLLGLTDVAMNIAPTLDEKVQIVQNAVDFMRGIGFLLPKVAPICAVETVNPKMEATLHAAALTQMCRRGQIRHCLVDGPLAFDNAISAEAAQHKGIQSEVAGDADLLLFPNIEAGNAVYKSLAAFASAQLAAVILGATVPVVLTSRADSEQAKLNSILLAAAL